VLKACVGKSGVVAVGNCWQNMALAPTIICEPLIDISPLSLEPLPRRRVSQGHAILPPCQVLPATVDCLPLFCPSS
jgi:hypothetical protein